MEAVIEHLPNPLKQMREIASFLKPGGLFVLTTPNMDSGNFKLLRSFWTPALAPHVHLFLFGSNSIKALLSQVGLEPVRIGSLQAENYTLADYARRALSGDIKGVAWRGGSGDGQPRRATARPRSFAFCGGAKDLKSLFCTSLLTFRFPVSKDNAQHEPESDSRRAHETEHGETGIAQNLKFRFHLHQQRRADNQRRKDQSGRNAIGDVVKSLDECLDVW